MSKRQPASEETLHLCSLLGQELLTWPEVSLRPMFGYRAFYRGARIFALFPDKRALDPPEAIMYKLHDHSHRKEGEKWLVFELNARQIRDAILTLEKAYSKAK